MSQFPMYFPKCRICGSEELLTRLAWDEEAEKGVVNKDTPVAMGQSQVALIDPKRPPLISASAIIQYFDTCAGCGSQRCVRAEIVTGPISMKLPPNPPGPSGGPLSFR